MLSLLVRSAFAGALALSGVATTEGAQEVGIRGAPAPVELQAEFLSASQSTAPPSDLPVPTPSTSEPPPRYRTFLLTVDQGGEVWELFGHNALLIIDSLTGEELAWNWGMFNFDDDDFLPRFLRGTMRYTMGPVDSNVFISSYAASGRNLYANEIFLSQDEAAALDAFVRHNFLPENRPYIYHYFEDNCSTRVRDALDEVLGGILHDQFSDQETSRTYRWHARRLVQVEPWVDQGLSFLLGTKGDLPITEWEAMFAPLELMRFLEGVERLGENGERASLLGPRITVFESGRAAPPALPPSFSARWLILGLVLGGGIIGLAMAGNRGARWGRIGAEIGVIGWGLFSGLLGLLLFLSWFTDHNFIRWNLNIFYFSPLGLLLALATAGLLFMRKWEKEGIGRLARRCALLIALLAVGMALLQASSLLTQGNSEILALALPLNLAIAWSLSMLLPGK